MDGFMNYFHKVFCKRNDNIKEIGTLMITDKPVTTLTKPRIWALSPAKTDRTGSSLSAMK